jgi:phthiocerol/phenolphthiocerol synthesis type-I polyketide synthase C
LSAGIARTGTLPGSLSGFLISRGISLGSASDVTSDVGDDHTVRLGVQWTDDLPGGGGFRLLSLPPGAPEWVEHATAQVGLQVPSGIKPPGFPSRLRATPDTGAAGFYTTWGERGLGYGPAFQGIRRLFTEGEAALGEVLLSEKCLAGARPHGLHPALWDGALQVMLALCDAPEAVVPVAADRVLVLKDPREPVLMVWSYAVRTDETHFDVCLFDAAEEPLIIIEGLAVRPLHRDGRRAIDPDRVHVMRFDEQPRPSVSEAPGRWAVWGAEVDGADGADGVRALSDALTASGARVDGVDGADGVVFLAPSEGAGLEGQRRGLMALTSMVRACLAQPVPPRLAIVTAGAQAVVADDLPDAGGALYWGYFRVLRREHGELRPSIIDVTRRDTGWPAACAREVLAGDGEDEVALRGERRFTGRLVRGEPPQDAEGPEPGWVTPAQPFRLRNDRPGRWEGVRYRPLRRVAPGPGEVEIEVTAAALNFIDVLKAMGAYPDQSTDTELLGSECAGRIVAAGPGVTAFAEGDRVVACARGTLASHITVRADHVRPIPGALADTAAVTLPLAMCTAWYGLVDLARLSAAETVLIHSAAGGLGLAAVRVAGALGATVIATAGGEHKRAYLRGLGIAHVFDSRENSWPDAVREATGGRGADVVLNSLGGSAIQRGLDVLAEDGRFIEVGKKDIYAGRRISMTALKKGIVLAAVDLTGLMERRPGRFARLFGTVWDMIADSGFGPLPVTHYTFGEAAEALRTMALGQHIGKLVVTSPATVRTVVPEPMPEGRFRPDATYLITGGLGALGLSLAEFLAAHGAGAVALIGRSAPGADAAARVNAMRAGGTKVATYQADVASRPALRSALEVIRAELPPLRGVFHAAGLLDDATIMNLAPGQLDRVLGPKVDGARNLDEATAGDPLDLFVMFSSAAALFGTVGQAAYAAGNAFMDTLAIARRRRGLPALSVQWGPFSDAGLAAQDSNRGARLAAQGMSSLTTQEAWCALTRFLTAGEQVVGYVPVNLRQWFDAYPDLAAQRSWQVLRDTALVTTPDGNGAPGDVRPENVEATVREMVGRVLRLDPKAIEREASFKMLGLDSMLSLELRNRLEAAFGLTLPASLVWTHGNSRTLAEELCSRLSV